MDKHLRLPLLQEAISTSHVKDQINPTRKQAIGVHVHMLSSMGYIGLSTKHISLRQTIWQSSQKIWFAPKGTRANGWPFHNNL